MTKVLTVFTSEDSSMMPVYCTTKSVFKTTFAGVIIPAILVLQILTPALGTDSPPTILQVEKARKQVTLSGYTRGRTKMTVASEVTGKVLRVNYDVGQSIGKQPFVEIDATFINYQIEQVETSLKKLALMRSRSASRVGYLEKEYQRIARLRQSDVTSESRFDAAAEELTQARLELQSTEIETAALQTQLKELRERRSRHRIFAPQGWVVVGKTVEPGEIITSGHPLAQAADFTQLVVPLFVSAVELDALEREARVDLTLEGRPVQGTLNWVNPEFDERTRKLAIELIIPAYKGVRRGGLLAELSLEIDTGGLMVPKSAVSDRYENPRVTLKSSGESIPVVILGENGRYVLIADNRDLAPGAELQPNPLKR